VFVADIHDGPNLGKRQMDALVNTINGLDADIVILGGDYVGGRLNGAEVFYPRAKALRARLAKVAVLGNHDVWEGEDAARQGLRDAGITLLDNHAVRVEKDGESIVVGGVEDLETGAPDAVGLSEVVSPLDFAVLVSHNPDVFPGQLPETKARWDLGLAGHTHGGQVTFFGSVLVHPMSGVRRMHRGWSHICGMPVLVTNGVGTVTLPMRFFAPPEIHVITLRKSS
jgi:uncharacterized protein